MIIIKHHQELKGLMKMIGTVFLLLFCFGRDGDAFETCANQSDAAAASLARPIRNSWPRKMSAITQCAIRASCYDQAFSEQLQQNSHKFPVNWAQIRSQRRCARLDVVWVIFGTRKSIIDATASALLLRKSVQTMLKNLHHPRSHQDHDMTAAKILSACNPHLTLVTPWSTDDILDSLRQVVPGMQESQLPFDRILKLPGQVAGLDFNYCGGRSRRFSLVGVKQKFHCKVAGLWVAVNHTKPSCMLFIDADAFVAPHHLPHIWDTFTSLETAYSFAATIAAGFPTSRSPLPKRGIPAGFNELNSGFFFARTHDSRVVDMFRDMVTQFSSFGFWNDQRLLSEQLWYRGIPVLVLPLWFNCRYISGNPSHYNLETSQTTMLSFGLAGGAPSKTVPTQPCFVVHSHVLNSNALLKQLLIPTPARPQLRKSENVTSVK